MESQRFVPEHLLSPRRRHNSEATGRLELAYARSVVDHGGHFPTVGLCNFDIILLFRGNRLKLNIRVFRAKRENP